MRRLVLLGFTLPFLIFSSVLTFHYYRLSQQAEPSIVVQQTHQDITEQNKLASYKCEPQTDATRGQVMICTSGDGHSTYVCTSVRLPGDSFEYFC